MSEIFMTSGKTMMYRNTMIDIGDGSYEEIKQAMEKVDKGIEEEQFKKWAEFLKNHPIQLAPTDEHAERLAESMRWTRLTNTLDDIRDLLYVNNLSLGALINLMLTMGTPMNEDDRRSVFKDEAKSAMEILDKMEQRNEKSKKHIESLMAEYNAILRGQST